jgi:hypothetical protein
VENSDASYSNSVPSGGTLILPNQEIQNNGVASGFIPSVGTINVTTNASPTSFTITGRTIDIVVPSGSTPSGVLFQRPILQQYTSFANYDEGWRAQNGWNSAYTPPSNPAAIAELDYSLGANYWYRLKNNLIVGGVSNKIRFVDVDGGQTWSSTGNKNLITIDKLTGLGIYRFTLPSTTWALHLSAADSLSITVNGVVYNNWFLTALCEYNAFFGILFATTAQQITDQVSSVQFADGVGADYFTSTTRMASTGTAYNRSGLFEILATNKVNSCRAQYIFDASSLITAP